MSAPYTSIQEHLPLFALLVVLNAFVGAMVGLERTVLPLLADVDPGLGGRVGLAGFIVVFAVSKAFANRWAGSAGDRHGRRPVLIGGWLLAVPVPILLWQVPTLLGLLTANALLGVSQGLAWSMTVVMKVDLAGPGERGLATGLNEFAGYGGLALAAWGTGWLASAYGLFPVPFQAGVGVAIIGLLMSILVSETRLPQAGTDHRRASEEPDTPGASGATAVSNLAGLATNLKDGVLWALLPLLLATRGFDVGTVGLVAAVYPATWGVLQLPAGPISDRVGRARMVVPGLLIQAAGTASFAWVTTRPEAMAAAVAAGAGTGLAYPTLLAFVADTSPDGGEARALGTYRFWRDLGYGVGAVVGVAAAAWASYAAALSLAGAILVAATAAFVCSVGLGGRRPADPAASA